MKPFALSQVQAAPSQAQSKRTQCAAGSGLALSVIAPRCHLSQSERPWQSAKFAVRHFTPCCRKGSRQALRSDFTPLPRALPLGELDAVRRPERARTAEGTLYPGLAGANDGADFRKPQSKLTRYVLVSGLALSVIAPRCHLSQSERPWQSAKFAVRHFTPCCRKGSRQALRLDFTPLPRAPPLGELDAVRRPERARTLAGRLRPGLDGAYEMGQTSESLDLNLRGAFLSADLPSPSSLCDATSPKVRGLGSPPSFPVYTLRPAAARGASGVTLRLHAFAKGSPFGRAGRR